MHINVVDENQQTEIRGIYLSWQMIFKNNLKGVQIHFCLHFMYGKIMFFYMIFHLTEHSFWVWILSSLRLVIFIFGYRISGYALVWRILNINIYTKQIPNIWNAWPLMRMYDHQCHVRSYLLAKKYVQNRRGCYWRKKYRA